MEGKKLEKKLRDWASDLNFNLPDGSAPPTNYFALLAATPHRRQLWETLVESVQPRQKIEYMRRQILVAKLKDKKKLSGKCDSASVLNRIQLWHKQTMLVQYVKEEGNEVMKLEGFIVAEVSDMLFDICKLAQLEKLYEEFSEKVLILRLFIKREKDMIKNLGKILFKVKGLVGCSDICGLQNNTGSIKDELLGAEECKSLFDDGHECELGNILQELQKPEVYEESMWEDVIRSKERLLSKFDTFLEELNSNEKNILSVKEMKTEESLSVPIRNLKQKATEKSLKVMNSSTEGLTLDWEIEKLGEILYKAELNGNVSEAISSLATNGTNDSLLCEEKAAEIVRKYMIAVGLRCYKELLEREAMRLEGEVGRSGGKEDRKTAEEFRYTAKTVGSDGIFEEIRAKKSKEEKCATEILDSFDRLKFGLRSFRQEAEEKEKAGALEDAEKLMWASEKLIDTFMEVPLDALRTIESCSGRLSFERESFSHCLSSYGGELNQFFSAISIPPRPDSRAILSEVEARSTLLGDVRNVINRRDELTQLQRKILQRMTSIKLDSRLCEMNFEESAGILWNVLLKSSELLRGTDFIESILRNWVEQPYRWMAERT